MFYIVNIYKVYIYKVHSNLYNLFLHSYFIVYSIYITQYFSIGDSYFISYLNTLMYYIIPSLATSLLIQSINQVICHLSRTPQLIANLVVPQHTQFIVHLSSIFSTSCHISLSVLTFFGAERETETKTPKHLVTL